MRLKDWFADDCIARVVDLENPRSLQWLFDCYQGTKPRVFQTCVNHALAVGARTVIVEYRYLDPDWRNEHTAFYNSTFRQYASVAHRLHFFANPPLGDVDQMLHPDVLSTMDYVGYCIVRSVPAAPVGRTFLRPRDLSHITCVSTDYVNLFGVELSVQGSPFVSQDAQLSRCAHTTTWVTGYHHYRAFGERRPLPAEISRAASRSIEHGRPLPSPGLTIGQMADAARHVGLPPLVYPLRHLAGKETIPRLVCRYLNSGLPVTVATRAHAFVLVGYARSTGPEGNPLLHFIRQDDQVGPYSWVEDWNLDEYGPWEYAVVPLPEKIYMPGESAEEIGSARIRAALMSSRSRRALDLLKGVDTHALSFRSTVVASNTFKKTLSQRGYGEKVATTYRRMQMSRYVWVVELTDRSLRNDDERCVLAEAVIDATDHMHDSHVLAWRSPDAMYAWLPDDDSFAVLDDLGSQDPVASVSRPTLT